MQNQLLVQWVYYLSSMSKKLFLLDAMALIYRAYYAMIRKPIVTSKGKNTNAQFGFTNTLFELIHKEKPSHMAVCFDTHAPTERHIEFTEYKANRQETPEDILEAIPDIKRIIRGFQIPVLESDGYEADDIIGTLAWQAADKGYEVYMVTPDKDYGQLLIHPHVYIYRPPFMGNKEEIYDAATICKKWDIQRVEQVVDMIALMGDAVDNIPGIPGIGEKTAAKLLKEYDNLENILAHATEIKGALGEKIRKGKELAILSKKLATIHTQVPIQFHEEDFCIKEYNKEALAEIFTELEFKTLGKRILGESFSAFQPAAQIIQSELFTEMETGTTPEMLSTETEEIPGMLATKNIHNTPHHYEVINTPEQIAQLVAQLSAQTEISFDTETTGIDPHRAELVGLSFCIKPFEAYYIPCSPNIAAVQTILQQLKPLFNNPDIVWIGQNIKYDLTILKWYGIEIQGAVYDTMLAHYLIEPESRRNMNLLSVQYLHYEPVAIETLIGKKGKNQGNMRDVPLELIKEYAAEDADITLQLKQVFAPLVKEKEVEQVLQEIENPLVKVLTNMEVEGVKIDTDFLKEYSIELEKEAKAAEQRVFQCCGKEFNLSSPKQLGEILFEQLHLNPKAKKTKTGQYATGEDVLLKLAHENEIVSDILVYRELIKLKSTYVDALPAIINPKTGRIHTCYSQAVAVTGRLSSINPNLQNIPIRTERGKEIRKAFIPRDANHVLLSADYSQIELRIVAALSGDANMIQAFRENKDIHTITAAKVYGVNEKDVTKEMRYKAKSVNFGIIYGQGAFGLSENLGISRAEARQIIDNYKKEFSGITHYIDESIAFARKHGYVQTLKGRKRWLKDIHSSNFTVRSFAERNAINSPIQGTAADMIKLAMIHIHQALQEQHLHTKMILQVHDELVFEVPKEEAATVQPMVLQLMKQALPLPNNVPVEAEAGFGDNWLEAHS